MAIIIVNIVLSTNGKKVDIGVPAFNDDYNGVTIFKTSYDNVQIGVDSRAYRVWSSGRGLLSIAKSGTRLQQR